MPLSCQSCAVPQSNDEDHLYLLVLSRSPDRNLTAELTVGGDIIGEAGNALYRPYTRSIDILRRSNLRVRICIMLDLAARIRVRILIIVSMTTSAVQFHRYLNCGKEI